MISFVITFLTFFLGIDKEDSFFGTERVVEEMRNQKDWPVINRDFGGVEN